MKNTVSGYPQRKAKGRCRRYSQSSSLFNPKHRVLGSLRTPVQTIQSSPGHRRNRPPRAYPPLPQAVPATTVQVSGKKKTSVISKSVSGRDISGMTAHRIREFWGATHPNRRPCHQRIECSSCSGQSPSFWDMTPQCSDSDSTCPFRRRNIARSPKRPACCLSLRSSCMCGGQQRLSALLAGPSSVE